MKGLSIIVILVVLASCSDADVMKVRQKDPGVYAHFDIRAEEGSEMATCVARFYKDKTRKRALALEEPANIAIDEQPLPVDSSQFLGAFYELQLPVSDFEGEHIITFTSNHNQQYKEELSFVPLQLHTELSGPIPKEDLVLELEGILPEDVIRVVMIDTSFKSEGINQLDTVKSGQLVIEKELLQGLKSGPVVLEISKESERPLVSGMKGIITTTYSLRRDLVLTD